MRKGRGKIWDSLTVEHRGGALQDHRGPLRGPSEDLTVEKVEDACAGIQVGGRRFAGCISIRTWGTRPTMILADT